MEYFERRIYPNNAVFATLPRSRDIPYRTTKVATLNIPRAGVHRTPRRRHFRNSPSSEREFNRTTINELQTQHSWLRSFSLFLSPATAISLPSLSFSLSEELSRECHRDAPASRSVSLSFSIFFLLPRTAASFSVFLSPSRVHAPHARVLELIMAHVENPHT